MHYGGHLRESFIDWLNTGQPSIALVEVNHELEEWPAERFLRRMLRCSDFLPRLDYHNVINVDGYDEPPEQTYGAVARVLLDELLEAKALLAAGS